MRKIRILSCLVGIFLIAISTIIFYCAYTQENRDTLFQVSTINALLDGLYDGEVTFSTLKQKGDFGLGTFNALDGEMVALDGKFYQVKADGNVHDVDNSAKTPFAAVTFFDCDENIRIERGITYDELIKYLDSLLPTTNIFYAIKITGTFTYIEARSVPEQSRPYVSLSEVTKNQPIFKFHHIDGTLVGFKCPNYVAGLNVPGYHFHFISKDGKRGGHLLNCEIRSAKGEIDYTTDFFMALPRNQEFYQLDLSKERQKELERVETRKDIDIKDEDADEDF